MVESNILTAIEGMLKNLKEDPSNSQSPPLFKKVISNSAPIWTAVEQYPAACFYLAETQYEDIDRLRIEGVSSVMIYAYNKHKTRGLSLKDILSPLTEAIRAEVSNLQTADGSILDAQVSKISRDGGTILPYTVAEIELNITFTELKVNC